MNSIQIIVGSMLGGTEYVAEACQEALEAMSKEVTIHFQPNLSEINAENQLWLVCTSTHGAGDYPDNIKPFIESLTNSDQDLSTTRFLTIGVGDSSYDTFCLAAKNIEKLLLSKGCKKITEPLLLDMQQDIDPEELASDWITNLKDQIS